jgi:YesN/AraC family two-component response regulator
LEKDRLSRQIVEHAANYLNSDLAIGTSLVQSALGPDLLLQAQRAIQTRFVAGNRGVYRFETVGEQDARIPVEELKLLERYLQRQDLTNTRQILDTLFDQTRIGPAVSVYTQHICRSILDLLVKEFGVKAYDLVEPEFIQITFLDGLDSPTAIAQRIYDNLAKVVRGQAAPLASGANLIEQITAYIAEHYPEDISLKHLADTFSINYSYLSTLFKQETGQSVVNYLTGIRLERASHLLLTTTADIATIAEMTGYSDLNYFYRLFKKHFGLTPLSYRNQKNVQ